MNPGVIAPEVSLVQPYDGGGVPLGDPSQSVRNVTSATVAAADTELLVTDESQCARLYTLSCFLSAGVAPSAIGLFFHTSAGAAGAMTKLITVPAANYEALPSLVTMCPPGHTIQGRHFGGDAATIVVWQLVCTVAPLGTVFYV